jgi:GDPmannose 4,6-dehydratase
MQWLMLQDAPEDSIATGEQHSVRISSILPPRRSASGSDGGNGVEKGYNAETEQCIVAIDPAIFAPPKSKHCRRRPKPS